MATNWTMAEKIMGRNMVSVMEITPPDWKRTLQKQLQWELRWIPFSCATLEQCAATHILVPGLPKTVFELLWEQRCDDLDEHDMGWRDWYGFETEHGRLQGEMTANATICQANVQWYLIRKEIVPESFGLDANSHGKLLQRFERLPLACEIAHCYRTFAMLRGETLLPNIWVRCTDTYRYPWTDWQSEDRYRFRSEYVGNFQPDGYFHHGECEEYDDEQSSGLGICPCWKLPGEK